MVTPDILSKDSDLGPSLFAKWYVNTVFNTAFQEMPP